MMSKMTQAIDREQVWCELDTQVLINNMRALRKYLPTTCLLAPAVKSNGYGHGMLEVAQAFLAGGADWLCVHTVDEARTLRSAHITCPIYLFGPTLVTQLDEIVTLGLEIVLYQSEHIYRLTEIAQNQPHAVSQVGLHLKVETGNHRQGVSQQEALELVKLIKKSPHLRLAGVTSHFANIEDTNDHSFAELQLKRLQENFIVIEQLWGSSLMCHMANSAATLLWPNRALSLARVGIASYGLWPSKEVQELSEFCLSPALKPALSWRVRIAQVKEVPTGAPIGYGCTYVTTRPSKIAVLPVGYFEGYDRGLSNRGEVLIRGQRAPIRGRICMNMCMVDVTEIHGVIRGDIATLIGQDGNDEISADEVAQWCETIHYEVVTRIATHIPRYPI